MRSISITTERLVLDQPVSSDRNRIAEYCRDPAFESYMTLPWPYEPKHADFFIDQVAPNGWARKTEFNWAIREGVGMPILGAIGYRLRNNDLGYWLGAPHRGNGYMTEALVGVTDWLFSIGTKQVLWECIVGNTPSANVAQRAGFEYTGERPSDVKFRDGSHPPAWHGVRRPGMVPSLVEWPA